jgi:hypothetical protein
VNNLQATVLDGDDWLCPRVREMFAKKYLGYSVANCTMVRAFMGLQFCGHVTQP